MARGLSVEEEGGDEYVMDGSVDLKGRPVLRSKRGGLKACSFIVVYEVFERMAFYGIVSNLVIYLTTKLHEGTVKSSNNVTNWVGTVWMMPVVGAYIADAYFGRYWTFTVASGIYFLGMCLLTLSVSLPSLRPPPCGAGTGDPGCNAKATDLQLGVFFLALYILAVGTGGTKPNISTIGAEQFDDFHHCERSFKLRFFNWWYFSIFTGTLFAYTVLVYVQDNVGWAIGYGIPTIGLLVSIVIFLVGTPFYRHRQPTGSALTDMARVFVAAMRKIGVPTPTSPSELHELSPEEYAARSLAAAAPRLLERTPTMRKLDKAAVKIPGVAESRWSLCTVTEVEETKQMLRMIPILIATFIPSTMYAQLNTLFVKQGTMLDRHIGPYFKVPPASLQAFTNIGILVSIVVYDRFFVPAMRRWTKNPRGISLLQRIGVGMALHVAVMVVSSVTEWRRLKVAADHGLTEKKEAVPLTIFTLMLQFLLTGVADCFIEIGKLEFFYDQAPESMKSVGVSYYSTSLGVGNFLSSFLLKTAARVTKSGDGRKGWILDNLNASRLDYYYAFLAVLNVINFGCYLMLSRAYSYRTATAVAAVAAGDGGGVNGDKAAQEVELRRRES